MPLLFTHRARNIKDLAGTKELPPAEEVLIL
jgi:hypothetical protein